MPEQTDSLTPAATHPELPARMLRWYVDPSQLDFPSTAFVAPLEGIIGQDRALESLKLGAQIYSPGYNIFVSGLSGTGRTTTIKNILEKIHSDGGLLRDYAYVHNFCNTDQPRLLRLPKGRAAKLSDAIDQAITYLRTQIPKMFEDETFRAGRTKIVDDFQEKERRMLEEFEERLKPEGFALGQRKTSSDVVQPEILPLVNGKPYPIAALDDLIKDEALSHDDARRIGEHYKRLQPELYGLARQGMKLTQEFQRELAEYEREATRMLIDTTLDEVRQRFPFDEVIGHLNEMQNHIQEHLETFKRQGGGSGDGRQEESRPEDPFRLYRVNVLLDNTDTEGRPVVIETTPTFINIFGTVERVLDANGFWTTDFTRIKAGSLLNADGGYLIMSANDALSEPGVWKALKRVLLHRKLEIQSIESFFQTSSAQVSALKPQAIDLSVKVILIGDSRLYQVLYQLDEDFRKIFKINAEFDFEIDRDDTVITDYARFIRRLCDEEHLLQFDRDGVAAVVEYAVEKASKNTKISVRFSEIADVLREASFWADRDRAEVVSRYHVEKAHSKMIDRNSMWKYKVMERIMEGTLLIATDGRRVGQINGLAVYSMGQISFGKPTRITATTFVGSSGVVNIEREARLSGSIYNKGTLILIGFFRNRFAQRRPLAFGASVVFEQSYGGIEGDSASSTEVYALMSSLSGVPIQQNIAVTGSVNQWGEIQPIGGVKEKIEGFYDVCKARGLTRKQGVLIPIQNVTDLMLRADVVEAVAAGEFHVWAVSSIDQGIEILTGIAAGERDPATGNYPPGTVNYLIEQRLADLAERLKESGPVMANGTTPPIVDVEIGGGGERKDDPT
ncbi:MAG TPA: ATP-binding protein [Candidatus Kapabacteria bacterium]|nr:ATP-binding protein [Candidatus Kapabacteria bacterium]